MRDWLIAARKKKGVSQKTVSKYACIKQPTYCEYEHGISTPTPAIAKKVAEFLGFNWTHFYEEEGEHIEALADYPEKEDKGA